MDGSSHVQVMVDYSKDYEDMKRLKPMLTEEAFMRTLNESCKVDCRTQGLKLIYDKDFENGDFYNFTIDYDWIIEKRTKLTVYNLPRIDPIFPSYYPITDNELIRELKLRNATLIYKITLPEPISEAPDALKISGKTATFDIMSVINKKDKISVVSVTYDIYRIILSFTVLIIVYLVVKSTLTIIFKEKPPKPKIEEEYYG